MGWFRGCSDAVQVSGWCTGAVPVNGVAVPPVQPAVPADAVLLPEEADGTAEAATEIEPDVSNNEPGGGWLWGDE